MLCFQHLEDRVFVHFLDYGAVDFPLQDEPDGRAAVLLVLLHGRQQKAACILGGDFSLQHRMVGLLAPAVLFQYSLHIITVLLVAESQVKGKLQCTADSPSHCITVGEGSQSCAGLQSVGEGVAQVQLHPQSGLRQVLLHDAGLGDDAAADDLAHQLWLPIQHLLLLVLENLQDPGNLGTIIRTAEGAGVTGILMSRGTADLYNPKVTRSTMGSIFRVPFLYTDDLSGTIGKVKQAGVTVCAAHLQGRHTYDGEDYTRVTAFLIGNESRGLSDGLSELADVRVRIPMAGKVESLNAAVAAAILMYEAGRQRRAGRMDG